MLTLVLGGSGSGKSEYAENLMAAKRAGLSRGLTTGAPKNQLSTPAPMHYIATMWFNPDDEECIRRIERHRRMRRNKGFSTIECPADLEQADVEPDSVALLECMSNLVANEMFSGGVVHEPEAVAAKVGRGIDRLLAICREVCVVSNDIFGDGIEYDQGTMAYIEALGLVNKYLAAAAGEVTEVVYGIPVQIK